MSSKTYFTQPLHCMQLDLCFIDAVVCVDIGSMPLSNHMLHLFAAYFASNHRRTNTDCLLTITKELQVKNMCLLQNGDWQGRMI